MLLENSSGLEAGDTVDGERWRSESQTTLTTTSSKTTNVSRDARFECDVFSSSPLGGKRTETTTRQPTRSGSGDNAPPRNKAHVAFQY